MRVANMVRLISLGLAVLPSIAAYRIPQPAVLPRQGVSNSSFAPSTTVSTQTATAGSSSSAASITTAPLPIVSASGNGTCPVTSYPGDFPDRPFATFTETCQSAQSRIAYDKFYYLTDSCLASYCEAQWDSTWDIIGSASTTVLTTSTRTWFSGVPGTGSLSTVITGQQYWTSTYTYAVDAAQLVSLESPCCGQCTFADPTIQLYFWPTATADPTPSVTGLPGDATAMVTGLPIVDGTYVDDSGFTFISPSIYLGFTSLTAHNWCGPVGSEIYNTTVAFDPTEVSTMFPQVTRATCTVTGTSRDGTPYTTTDFDVTTRTPSQLTVADVAQDCSTIDGYYWFADNPSNAVGDAAGDPCHPVIALPTKIQELQPAWSDCLPIYGGFYDPPKTLKRGTALVPTTASETPEPTSQPEPSQADPTSAADPDPTQVAPSPSETPDPTQPDPTSQQPDPTQADPTSPQNPTPSPPQPPVPSDPQNPTPSAPQPPAQSDPQDPSVSQPAATPQPSNPAAESTPSRAPSDPQTPAPANPAPSGPQQPSVPVPGPSQSPPDTPQQPSNPGQGSSTTITIPNPPPSNLPSVPAPVITLDPVPVPNPQTPNPNPQDPQNPNPQNPNPQTPNPQDPNPQNPTPPEITLQPTLLPPTNPTLPSTTALIIGTQTLVPGAVITIGGTTTTLPNGQPTVSGGTQLALDPAGTAVVIGGTSTVQIPAPAPTPAPVTAAGSPVVVTVGGTTLTADSETRFEIGGVTLGGGGTVVQGGSTFVLTTDEGGSTVLVVGSAGVSATATATATASLGDATSISTTQTAGGNSSSATGGVPLAPTFGGAATRTGGRGVGLGLGMLVLSGWVVVMG